METIGEKISQIRKKKGYTQEELSDLAKINLRTLQRIEKGETEPRGNTIKSLCKILEINIEEILDYGKVVDYKFFVYFHLSVILGFIVPIGNIIIPLILWLNKKDKIIFLNEQGIKLINFQIWWTAALFISMIVFWIDRIQDLAKGLPLNVDGLIYFFYATLIVNFVYPLIISIIITKTKTVKKYYPGLIKLVR